MMNNIYVLVKNELIKYTRQPMVILFAIIFPSFWVWLSQNIYTNESSTFFGGYGTINFMFPSYCVLIFLVTGLNSLPIDIANNKQNNTLMRYKFTSLTKKQYITSLIISNWLINFLAVLILYVTAHFTSDIYTPNSLNIIIFLLISMIGQVMISSIGIIISNIIKGFKNVLYTSLIVYFASMFLSGATIPLQTFPKNILSISKILPFTYIIKLMRYYWLDVPLSNHVIVLVFIVIITIILNFVAILTFKWSD